MTAALVTYLLRIHPAGRVVAGLALCLLLLLAAVKFLAGPPGAPEQAPASPSG
ncbi:hypothetical protein [Streptomyces globisporus]|uniref:hypothetical protein n=1 Tax=Streptomyces globisporus TaxID=1908 RepID=UPI001F35E06F|nr:hypothetical protein [Streptomyces globisporus]